VEKNYVNSSTNIHTSLTYNVTCRSKKAKDIDRTWSEGDCWCFECSSIEVVESFRMLLGTEGCVYVQLLRRSSQ